jgi:hypothetical protein
MVCAAAFGAQRSLRSVPVLSMQPGHRQVHCPTCTVQRWCRAPRWEDVTACVVPVAQGCGIVVYEHITSALGAMEALHNKYHWTGGETTMVVEWADPSRHRRENPTTKGTYPCTSWTLATF